MNSHSPSPSSGRSRAARGADARSGTLRYMSPLQADAYLMARDAVRRVQRSSALLDAGLRLPAGKGAQGDRHSLH